MSNLGVFTALVLGVRAEIQITHRWLGVVESGAGEQSQRVWLPGQRVLIVSGEELVFVTGGLTGRMGSP